MVTQLGGDSAAVELCAFRGQFQLLSRPSLVALSEEGSEHSLSWEVLLLL